VFTRTIEGAAWWCFATLARAERAREREGARDSHEARILSVTYSLLGLLWIASLTYAFATAP